MKLSIVIPAYNEEQCIAAIIERTLAARERIGAGSPVNDVEIIVVSDGSTDRTVEIASRYSDIILIVFEKNRGYGAAIKRGFEAAGGELVGFLDADGTCDPAFFAALCKALLDEEAAVAIGSRLGAHSRMPRIRRLGNRIYALILSALSNKMVTDTASGMRVIRRDALARLYPLPDGLHFTPAMSARVLMDDRLKIVERPMAYEERIGDSKLHVVRDGMRFLRTIFEMSLMWRPGRLFAAAAIACLAVMALLAAYPLEMWLTEGRLREDMIYRLLFCSLLGTCGITLLSTATVCDLLQRYWDDRPRERTFLAGAADRLYTFGGWSIAIAAAAPTLAWLVGRGVWTRATAGYVDLHWSRIVLAGLIAFAIGQMLVTVLVANLVRFHTARKSASHGTKIAGSSAQAAWANPPATAVPSVPAIVADGPVGIAEDRLAPTAG